MEKQPINTSEAIRFSGGVSKILRNIEEEISVISQNLARAADLIYFYEAELMKIATTKNIDNVEDWARKTAKQALKQGKKM